MPRVPVVIIMTGRTESGHETSPKDARRRNMRPPTPSPFGPWSPARPETGQENPACGELFLPVSAEQHDAARKRCGMGAEHLLDLAHHLIDILDPKAGIELATSQFRVGQDDPAGAIAIDLLDDIR